MNKKTVIIIICALAVIAACVTAAVFLIPHNGKDVPDATTGTDSTTEISEATTGSVNTTEATDNDVTAVVTGEGVTEETVTEETVTKVDPTIADTADVGLNVAQNVSVESVFSYTGLYVEDGTDEVVERIVAVNVKNSGTSSVQYLTFTLKGSNGLDYKFDLSTLLPGETVTVLEKNRAPFDKNVEYEAADYENCIFFEETPSMCQDVLKVSTKGHEITVKNISDKTLASCKVYYKNVNGNSLIGGITYTVGFENIAPGQELTAVSKHFDGDASRIMFLTYAEQ